MARTLYFDCFSGASGDMILGALLDLGLPLDGLRAALGSLALDVGEIGSERVLRAGLSATKFHLREPHGTEPHRGHAHRHEPERAHHHDHPRGHGHSQGQGSSHGDLHDAGHSDHRHDHGHDDADGSHAHGHHSIAEIAAHIRRSALSAEGKDRAIHLFERLAEAEANVHDVPVERVHLHEVGALDSIVDVVGAVHGLEWLAADEIVSSPLNVGGGTVRCAHGVMPVPAPATARLLAGVPIYGGDPPMELVTPTGALLVTGYAQRYGPLPPLRIASLGYGAGDRNPKGHPNVLRLVVGEGLAGTAGQRIVVLECEIDDMNPQLFGPLMDRLLEAGALDVFYAPVQMKKNRPGTLVTIIAPPERREPLSALLFAESTTIGVRYQELMRECLARETRTIDTPAGPIRFKVASRDGRILNASPEFDDCAGAAARLGVPIKDVQAMAISAWQKSRP